MTSVVPQEAGSGSGSNTSVQGWEYHHSVWLGIMAAALCVAFGCFQMMRWHKEQRLSNLTEATNTVLSEMKNVSSDVVQLTGLNEVAKVTRLDKLTGAVIDTLRTKNLESEHGLVPIIVKDDDDTASITGSVHSNQTRYVNINDLAVIIPKRPDDRSSYSGRGSFLGPPPPSRPRRFSRVLPPVPPSLDPDEEVPLAK